MEDGARKPPSYYSFLFCNNYAKYKEEVGYFKVGRWSPSPVLPHPKNTTLLFDPEILHVQTRNTILLTSLHPLGKSVDPKLFESVHKRGKIRA